MKYLLKIFLFSVLLVSCVEPVEIELSETKDFLVVQATITNEVKKHTVKLSRTYNLSSNTPVLESNATVYIEDDLQNTYSFTEQEEGTYISNVNFAAELDRTYVLNIVTSDGKNYQSNSEKITGLAEIDNITAKKELNLSDEEGLMLYVTGKGIDSEAKNFRYEYEETYKIVAPYYSDKRLIFSPGVFQDTYTLVDDDTSSEICYISEKSNKIIQTETSNISQNEFIYDFEFINKESYKISHRYSILLKQHVQSFDAYQYYKTLNNLSSSDDPFNQNQAGFIGGNINSTNNSNEKVIGYFEVNSVSEKRIFFNGRDFYPDVNPGYPTYCALIAPALFGRPGVLILKDYISAGNHIYYIDYEPGLIPDLGCEDDPNLSCGPYVLVSKACGDCKELGSDIKPIFWID